MKIHRQSKILILFLLLLISSTAFSQGKTYKNDSLGYSFFRSDFWKDMPASMESSITGGKKEKVVMGQTITYVKSLVSKDSDELEYPYILIQLLGDNPDGSFSIMVQTAEEQYDKGYEVTPGNSKEKINDVKSVLFIDKQRKIVYLKMGLRQPDKSVKLHLTAMMLAGSKAFQLNFFSDPDDFKEDLDRYFEIIDSFKVN